MQFGAPAAPDDGTWAHNTRTYSSSPQNLPIFHFHYSCSEVEGDGGVPASTGIIPSWIKKFDLVPLSASSGFLLSASTAGEPHSCSMCGFAFSMTCIHVACVCNCVRNCVRIHCRFCCRVVDGMNSFTRQNPGKQQSGFDGRQESSNQDLAGDVSQNGLSPACRWVW